MARGAPFVTHARVRQCSKCGKVFRTTWNYDLCGTCRAQASDKEQLVRDFVMHNRNATILDIAEQLKVSGTFIRRMINEGKLDQQESEPALKCRGCGTPISVGNYCQKCLSKMKQQIDFAKNRIINNMQKQGKISASEASAMQKKSGNSRGDLSSRIHSTRPSSFWNRD